MCTRLRRFALCLRQREVRHDSGPKESGDSGAPTPCMNEPPTSEQQPQIAHLGAELEKHGKLDLALLFLAVTAIASARSW